MMGFEKIGTKLSGSKFKVQRLQAMDTAHKISKNGAYNETFKKSSVKLPPLN